MNVVCDERSHREPVGVGGPQTEEDGAEDAHTEAGIPRREDDGMPQAARPAVQERVEVEAAEQHQHVEWWVPHRRAIFQRAERKLVGLTPGVKPTRSQTHQFAPSLTWWGGAVAVYCTEAVVFSRRRC
eukprot:scaffold53081_cov61-Phaeocystis_antarctica.AAC.5